MRIARSTSSKVNGKPGVMFAGYCFHFLRLSLLVSLLLLASQSVQAISLNEYHRRVREAVSALDSLAQIDETESASDYQTRNSETINGVRSLLPQTETVEWDGANLEVDYTWLHRELETLSSAPAGDQRKATLRRITERLKAIEERITEVVETDDSTSTKAEEARKLAEILSRPEYARKVKEETALIRLIKRLIKWITELLPQPSPVAEGTASIFSKIAQIFVIALALGVIGYVLKLFLPRLISSRRSKKKEKATARIVLGEKLEPDQSSSDLLAEAESLARKGELRAAIRKAYIALLVELGDRKIISLAQHKTNRDYLRAVREMEPLHGNVRTLTNSFEQHWYGLTNATESDWMAFRAAYKETLAK